MDEYIGAIKIFAIDYEPEGWMFCQGQTLSIADNKALYSVIGNMYGGDGITNFMLPDFGGRTPLGMGLQFKQNDKGGNKAVKLTLENIPSHTHEVFRPELNFRVNNDSADITDPAAAYLAAGSVNAYCARADASPLTQAIPVTGTINIHTAGDNLPIDIQMPFMVLSYLICTSGTYPTRN